MYDAIIIGSGPAGLSTALNLQIHEKSFVWFGSRDMSDKIKKAQMIDNYPGLPGNKYHELAKKYMPKGTCGVISFGLKGGRGAAEKMMDQLSLAAIVTHVADARTCVLHPASHTHRQMTDAQLVEAGVAPDLIRFSVGIENVNDIIADLEHALSCV